MSKINEIDLSKIAVREMPTKTIKANFDGTEREYTIRALNDGEKMNFQTLLASRRDALRVRSMYVLLLSCGLGWEQDVCEILFDNCNAEALRVGEAIFNFSRFFEEEKVRESEEAEKNSEKEPSSAGTVPSSQAV